MPRSFFPRRALFAAIISALLLTAGCRTPETPTAAAPATSTAAAAPALSTLDYSGPRGAIESVDRQLAAAQNDAAKLRELARQLIAVLQDSAATFAARQAVAERLGHFPADALLADDGHAAFVRLLLEPRNTNLARLALDVVPGPAVDAVYVEALEQAPPTLQLALVQSAGNRAIAAATPRLASFVSSPDFALSLAALKALGQIGTAEALRALRTANRPTATPVVEAELAAAHRLTGEEAKAAFEALATRESAPTALRASALRALLFLNPTTAGTRMVKVLSGDDAVTKAVIIEAIPTLPADAVVPPLTAAIAQWAPATQQAVVRALGHTADARAVPAITGLLTASDAEVRSAAIEALGRLPGSAATAVSLARVATGSNSDEAKLARQSLARLNGPDVAATVVDQARHGELALRVVFLEQFASRYMADQVPLLLEMRQDPEVAVRSAALGSLAEIAPPATQATLLEWAIAASDPTEQSRALRALASVTLRNADAADRARPITDALDRATPAVAVRLLPVLPRIGGAAAAECAARLGLRDDSSTAMAAANALARWPDDTGLAPLVSVAEKASVETARRAAVQGTIRTLNRSRSLPAEQLTSLIRRLLAAAQDPSARRQLVYLLGRATDDQSLTYAEQLRSDPELAEAAADAVLAIKAAQLGRPTARASARSAIAGNALDQNPATEWGVPAEAGVWFEIDFHATRPVRTLVFENGEHNYPELLEIYVTDDLEHPGTAVASKVGEPRKTTIELPQVAHGRYLIVRHPKAREDSWWVTTELLID